MRLFELKTGEPGKKWVDLHSVIEIQYTPLVNGAPQLSLTLSSSSVVNVADASDINKIVLILGISIT